MVDFLELAEASLTGGKAPCTPKKKAGPKKGWHRDPGREAVRLLCLRA